MHLPAKITYNRPKKIHSIAEIKMFIFIVIIHSTFNKNKPYHLVSELLKL